MKSIKIIFLFLLLFCAPQLQVDSEAQIPIKKCSVCGRPVSNCDYKGNHPKCKVCGKVKEQCAYKGNHPKCSTCGNYKDQCQYKGNHPKPIQKETFTANGVSFVMIKVEGGSFKMGASVKNDYEASYTEEPVHNVIVSTFFLGETEITQALWKAVMGYNPSYHKGDNLPVEQVSWDGCQLFINKLNSITGKKFRLPTEEEWEYSARGGINSRYMKYSGSNRVNEVAWYRDNSSSQTHDVMRKKPNELGIYDMSGNVLEWTSSYWRFDYNSSINPKRRVIRGGDWQGDDSCCRSATRFGYDHDYSNKGIGFRLAL